MDGYVAWRLHPDTSCQLLFPCSYQHCDEQQFQILSCAVYTFFFSNKARFSHTSTVTRLHYCSEKKTYAYAVRACCCYIEINIVEHF